MKLAVHGRICFLVLAAAFAGGWSTANAVSPEETIREAIAKMKETKSALAFVDYVSWDHAVKEVPPRERARLGLASGEDLRVYVVNMMTAPAQTFARDFESDISKLPPAKRIQAKQVLAERVRLYQEQLVQAMENYNAQLSMAEYEIGKATIKGSEAVVPVAMIDGDFRDDDFFKMVKINGTWKLSSIQWFQEPFDEEPPSIPKPQKKAPQAGR